MVGDRLYADSQDPRQRRGVAGGGGTLQTTISGLHFNNATTKAILTIPSGSSLTVSSTTLVSQTAGIVLAGAHAGSFSTFNLSIVDPQTLPIPSVSIAGRLSGQGTIAGNVTFTGSTLNWTAIPEPSSALAGLLLAAGLLRRRR